MPDALAVRSARVVSALRVRAPRGDGLRSFFALTTVSAAVALIFASQGGLFIVLRELTTSLHASPTDVQWVLDGFTVVLAAGLLPAGYVSDRFGRRRTLQLGLVVYAVGAAGLALAQTPILAIALRIVMGVGAALAFPATLATITATFPAERRRLGITVWSTTAISGAFAGLIIAAAIVEVFSWRAIAWAWAIIAVVVAAAAQVTLTESSDPARRRFDARGAALVTVGVAALVYGIIESPQYGLSSPVVVVAIAGGLLSFVAFLVWELRCPAPLLELRLLTGRHSVVGLLGLVAVFFGSYVEIASSIPYLEGVRGYSPLRASLSFLVFGATMLPFAVLSGALARRLAPVPTVAFGLVLMAVGIEAAALADASSPFLLWAIGGMVCGAGTTTAQGPATELVVASLPRDAQGVASAVNDVTRELGAALAIALVGAVLTATAGHTGDPRRDFMVGWRHDLLAVGIVMLAFALAVIVLDGWPRRSGQRGTA